MNKRQAIVFVSYIERKTNATAKLIQPWFYQPNMKLVATGKWNSFVSLLLNYNCYVFTYFNMWDFIHTTFCGCQIDASTFIYRHFNWSFKGSIYLYMLTKKEHNFLGRTNEILEFTCYFLPKLLLQFLIFCVRIFNCIMQ